MTMAEQNDIHFLVAGQGPPVILLHGLAASCYDWAAMLPALASAGFRAYAPDLIGHGESLKPETNAGYQVEIVYRYLIAWIDSLALEHPPVLVGHSLGGYLSLLYGLRKPGELAGMILIDPLYSPDQLSAALRWINRRPEWGEFALRLLPEWLLNVALGLDPTNSDDFDELARQQIASDYKRASARIVHIPATIEDLLPHLTQLATPSLLLWGERDLTLAPHSFLKLHKILANSQAREVRGSGHQPHIGKPEEVNRLVLNFLQGLQQQAPESGREYQLA